MHSEPNWPVVIFLGICFLVEAVNFSISRRGRESWHRALQKPRWASVNCASLPVSTVLYALMGVAGFLDWRSWGWPTAGLVLFAIALGLSVLWNALYFGARNPGLGLVALLPYGFVTLLTTLEFFRVSGLAGALMVPALVCIAYAGGVNYCVWALNICSPSL